MPGFLVLFVPCEITCSITVQGGPVCEHVRHSLQGHGVTRILKPPSGVWENVPKLWHKAFKHQGLPTPNLFWEVSSHDVMALITVCPLDARKGKHARLWHFQNLLNYFINRIRHLICILMNALSYNLPGGSQRSPGELYLIQGYPNTSTEH